MKTLFHLVIKSQKALSRLFDRLLPASLRKDGNRDYIDSLVPGYIRQGITVYDVGGGKSPLIDIDLKRRMNIRLVGIDIDQSELDLAPPGAYDRAICADICTYAGEQDADLIICQAVLEHVPDVEAALRTMQSILKPGGTALIFTPSKNAVFARLNRIMPERLKRAILFGACPETKEMQGFPAYYDRCTPADFRKIACQCGLDVKEERFYFVSSYLSIFFPLYLLWRVCMLLAMAIVRDQAAETFCFALQRPEVSSM